MNIMNTPLVSIITPCYNGAKYLPIFFESVLCQTYPRIELVFIDDGSVEKEVENLARFYGEKCEQKGYSFQYLRQEHKGQAAAINKGLKCFSGEYLTWPDSDDWMTDDCIEKKVNYLQNHQEWAMVCCRTAAFSDDAHDTIIRIYERKSKKSESFFEDLILEKDVYFAPGGYMVRSNILMNALQDGQIFEGPGGQNWQLLLPVAYNNICGFVDDILYFYRVRNDSHSQSAVTYQQKFHRTYEHEIILLETIERLSIDRTEKEKYIKKIKEKYAKKRQSLAVESNDKKLIRISYNEYKHFVKMDITDKLGYWRKMSKPIGAICKIAYIPMKVYGRIKRNHLEE